jgi:hypothetical protein
MVHRPGTRHRGIATPYHAALLLLLAAALVAGNSRAPPRRRAKPTQPSPPHSCAADALPQLQVGTHCSPICCLRRADRVGGACQAAGGAVFFEVGTQLADVMLPPPLSPQSCEKPPCMACAEFVELRVLDEMKALGSGRVSQECRDTKLERQRRAHRWRRYMASHEHHQTAGAGSGLFAVPSQLEEGLVTLRQALQHWSLELLEAVRGSQPARQPASEPASRHLP